jgi:hypothetical protein
MTRINVDSARQMHDSVMQTVGAADIFISVAAVADYRVKNRSEHKIKKGAGLPVIELEENPDILATVASLPAAPFCVGFAAESQNLLEFAEQTQEKAAAAAGGQSGATRHGCGQQPGCAAGRCRSPCAAGHAQARRGPGHCRASDPPAAALSRNHIRPCPKAGR